jgi:hypothetical protein
MINYIDIRGWSNEKWVAFRDQGVGGSEEGGIFNESKWDDRLKIHLNKIKEPVTTFTGNRFTKFGQKFESDIAHMYQYWDADASDPIMQMFANEEAKKKIETVRSVFAYVVNDKYPWLFASIDRRILRSKRNRRRRGILECKNTTAMEKNTYKYGINPSHVLQVYHYLMVLEWEYAEVAIFYDGNNWDVVGFEPDKEVFEMIQYETATFWQNVEKGRKIKEDYGIPSYYGMPDYYFSTERQKEGIAMLQELEPEITSTSYDWIKDLIIPTPEYTEAIGTQELFELGVKYHKAQKAQSAKAEEVTALKAKMIAMMKGIHVFKYDEGNISYKPTVKGDNRLHISQKLMK